MLKSLFLSFATMLMFTCLYAQTKAGKTDTLQHPTFYSCTMHPEVVSKQPGKCPKCGKKLNLSSKEQMKAEIAKVYTCPMHPEVALDKDGVCPKCGKDLVEKELKEKD